MQENLDFEKNVKPDSHEFVSPDRGERVRYHYQPEGIEDPDILEDTEFVSESLHEVKRHICRIYEDFNGVRSFNEQNLHVVKSEYAEEHKEFFGWDDIWSVITDRFENEKFSPSFQSNKKVNKICAVGFISIEKVKDSDGSDSEVKIEEKEN